MKRSFVLGTRELTNPVRKARRRGWAQKVSLGGDRRIREIGAIAQKTLPEEFDDLTQLWLAGIEDSDRGIRDFYNGTFGPWLSELLRLRRS